MKIELRPASMEDGEFLFAVYASTRDAEMAMVNWNAQQKDSFLRMQFAAQSDHYRQRYPQAIQSIIIAGGQPAGRHYISRNVEQIHILDLTVLPIFRNKGIGSELLGRLMSEAKESMKPLSVYVESFNPSLNLFQRLGFTSIEQTGVYYLLRWIPA